MINRSLPEREYQRLLAVERDRNRLLALINTPELLDFIEAKAARVVYQAADRLSAMIASYFSVGKSSIGLTC